MLLCSKSEIFFSCLLLMKLSCFWCLVWLLTHLVLLVHRLKQCAMKESLSIYLEWTKVSLIWLIIGLYYFHIAHCPHLVLFKFTLSHFSLQYQKTHTTMITFECICLASKCLTERLHRFLLVSAIWGKLIQTTPIYEWHALSYVWSSHNLK